MFLLIVLSLSSLPLVLSVPYEPTWESLDSRPLPQWYDDVKLGIIIHWGVYSVPSISSHHHLAEWFWSDWINLKDPLLCQFMIDNYPPGFRYADFAPMFRAELFDAERWVDMFEGSGAKLVYYFHTFCLK